MSKKISSAKTVSTDAAITTNSVMAQSFIKLFAVSLIVVLMGGIAFNGLFHEKNYLDEIMILGFLGILFLCWSILAKRQIHWRSIPAALGMGFVAAYSINLITAVYTRSAVLAMSKYLGVLLLIILIQNIKDRIPLKQYFLKGFYITGIILTLLGLDGIWGSKLIGLLQSAAEAMHAVNGREFLTNLLIDNGRVASLFHYPNTTAAFLLVAWMIGISLWGRAGQTKQRVLHGAATGLIGTAFILTLSRGSYLLAIPMVFLYLWLLPRETRLLYASGFFGTFMTAAILGIVFWPGSAARAMGLPGWGAAIITAGLISLFLNVLHSKIYAIGSKDADDGIGQSVEKIKATKRLWTSIILSCIALAVTAMTIAWLWMTPIQLSPDQDIHLNRIFSLEQPGDYALQIEFAKPLDPTAMQQLRIGLISQTPKEMFVGASQTLIDTATHDVQTGGVHINGSEYTFPFILKEAQLATESLTLQGRTGEANQITGLRIIRPQSNEIMRNLRLSRKLIGDSVSDRIENLFMLRSAFKRVSFYGDALDMFKDRPMTGGGGGAWEHLYLSYQDYRYTTSDVHSYPLQLLVEAGLFGAMMFLLTVAALAYKLIDLWRKPDVNQLLLWFGAVVLLGHSLIDFDFAFYSILLIFWALMAQLDFPAIRKKPGQTAQIAQTAEAGEASKTVSTAAPASPFRRWTAYLFCLALILVAIQWPCRFKMAAQRAEDYTEAATAQKAAAADRAIRKAVALDPLTADYKVALASLLVLRSNVTKEAYAEGNQLAAEVRQQADYNFIALEKLSDFYIKSVQWEKAYETETRITSLKPLEPLAWETKGQMIRNAIQWYSRTDKVDEIERQKQLALWLERGLAIPADMEDACTNKIETVTATPELEALLTQWTTQQAELALQ